MARRARSLLTTLAVAALGACAGMAHAQQAPAPDAAVLQSSSGPVRSGFGLCWRLGSAASAVLSPECGGPVAQADVVEPIQVVEPIKPPVNPVLPPMTETVRMEGVVHFEFDRAELTAQGRLIVDDLAAKILAGGGKVRVAYLVGHADRIGAAPYNHDLAFTRALEVAGRLVERGVPKSALDVREAGQSKPVVQCRDGRGLIACLAPNRRVEVSIEVTREAAR